LSILSFFPFIFTYIFTSATVVYWYLGVFPYVTHRYLVWLVLPGIVMAWLCYFVTWASNPGILPWDWSLNRRHVKSYTDDELKDGVASTREQVAWAKLEGLTPTRAFFSGHVGAIILKADHCCWYLNHFIGLRNMRFFFQSLFWGSIFTCGFLVSCVTAVRRIGFCANGCCCVLCITFGAWLVLVHLIQIRLAVLKIKNNETLIEMNSVEKGLGGTREKEWDLGLVKNLEETFGPVWLFPLWFFPVPLPLPTDGMSYKKRLPCFGLELFMPFS
jgi:hypothetical protein